MTNSSNSRSGETKGPAVSVAAVGGGGSGACSGLTGVCDASGSSCATALAGGSGLPGVGVVERTEGPGCVVELAGGLASGCGSIVGGAGPVAVGLTSGSSALAFNFARR